jgi:hypothetical protein
MEEKAKRYIGKDCRYGHGGERYTSNWRCVRCHQIRKTAAKKAKRAANPKKRGRPSSGIVDRKIYQREYAKTEKAKTQRKEYEKTDKFIAARRNKKAKQRAGLLQRTPKWLTEDDKWIIKEAYSLAVLREKIFGFKWEVDHIIPLRGKTVSGLHVPTNFQVIPMVENRKKSASFS